MANKRKQKGATMIEMALTLPLMILIILGIVEFSLLIFTWTKGVEATREGVRYASVSTPTVDLSGLDCSDGSTSTNIEADCGSDDCTDLILEMQKIMPEVSGDNVHVIYECSRTGNPDRPISMRTPEIRISIQDLTYDFIFPQIIGLGLNITMPEFTSTHTAEDLNTN